MTITTDVGPNKSESYFTDGRVIFSSCVPKERSEELNFEINKTSYNKIVGKIGNSSSFSFYNFYIFEPNNSSVVTGDTKFFRNNENITSIVENFQTSAEGFKMKFSWSSGDLSPNNSMVSNLNLVYVINDNFLSTLMLTNSNDVYLNSIRIVGNFSVLGKYKLGNEEKTRPVGEIKEKITTKPFYTGKVDGLLDQTYLNKIMWPYWINNLNTGSLYIDKVFLNWNPGNMENDMFYYAFVEVAGVKMLLYLSTNFTENDIKESQPVPIILSEGKVLYKNLFMQPYTRQLTILSKSCTPLQ